MISEFRFSGPQGTNDEFIELFYNNDFAPLTVSTSDGSSGWAVVSADGVTRFTIPNGTMIPQRGHYLIGNNSAGGYSLSDYGGSMAAAPDRTYKVIFLPGRGLLFSKVLILPTTQSRIDWMR